MRQALPVPITGVISDGQDSIRKAVARPLPACPHQLCHFHYLREAAKPISEADRHAKKELKKRVRGIRPIERRRRRRRRRGRTTRRRRSCGATAPRYAAALTDDGLPPLAASGLKLHERLSQIAASLDQVAALAGGLPGGLKRLRQLLRRGLEETAALWPPVREAYKWVKRVARMLKNEEQLPAKKVRRAPGATAGADASGGDDDGRALGAGGAEALPEGDQELLAGLVPVLRLVGPAADEQRSGARLRQPSLPRASRQWSAVGPRRVWW